MTHPSMVSDGAMIVRHETIVGHATLSGRGVIGRRALIGFGLTLGVAAILSSPTRAMAQRSAPPVMVPPVMIPPDAAPLAVVSMFNATLERMMRSGTTMPFKARFDMLAPAVDRAFDLATILSVSIGARWTGLDAAVKADLSTVFRTYTIASYVANFGGHEGEAFEIAPETRASGTDQIVRTRIAPRTGDGIKLDYVMRQSDAGWRAVDILADGTISRVAVQRSDFRGLLGRDGNTAALLDSLRKKIADLSGGAL